MVNKKKGVPPQLQLWRQSVIDANHKHGHYKTKGKPMIWFLSEDKNANMYYTAKTIYYQKLQKLSKQGKLRNQKPPVKRGSKGKQVKVKGGMNGFQAWQEALKIVNKGLKNVKDYVPEKNTPKYNKAIKLKNELLKKK